MIRYTLVCDQDHSFESWFQSSTAFDAVAKAGHVTCAICGSKSISRGLMTPSVSRNTSPGTEPGATPKPDLKTPQNETEVALDKMRREIEAKSDDVGSRFAKEARDMHEGHAPHRAIHGVAALGEAKKLIDDGVPVLPLPFMPKRKAN